MSDSILLSCRFSERQLEVDAARQEELSQPNVYLTPSNLVVGTSPTEGSEHAPFPTQPTVKVVDQQVCLQFCLLFIFIAIVPQSRHNLLSCPSSFSILVINSIISVNYPNFFLDVSFSYRCLISDSSSFRVTR